jgi:hypothetical protein
MVLVSQHDGIINILAVTASIQPQWPNMTIKLNLHVCVETLHTEVLVQRLKHMKMEYMYGQS